MSKLRLYGDTSGYIDVAAPATADNSTLDLSTVAKTNSANTFTGSVTTNNNLVIDASTDGSSYRTLNFAVGSSAGRIVFTGDSFSNPNYGQGDITIQTQSAGGQIRFGTGAAQVNTMKIDSSGRVTMPYQPAFLVGFGATNTISLNDGDQIEFDNDSSGIAFDNGNNFDTSGPNFSFTAPVTGIYSFNLTVKCSTVGNFSGVLKVNGANANIVDAPVGFSSSNDSCVTTLLIKLNENDYVKAHTRNGNYQLYKGHTFWSGHLVG